MKILIADDDGTWVRVLSRFLSASGHAVEAAATWEAARLLADRTLPDVVLLDASLSDGEAGGFCAALRSERRFDMTALVLLSGTADAACRGADRCLLKGESMAELEAAIAEARAAREAAGRGN